MVDVIDGDTLRVTIAGRTYSVRYLLSDAPQPGQLFGEEAAAKNRELVAGKEIYLERDKVEQDAYGNLLRYVYLVDDNTLINEELVRQGYAQVVVFPPNNRYEQRLREAQIRAQVLDQGLWQIESVAVQETESGLYAANQPHDSSLAGDADGYYIG